jgi:ketosteroid isomerase-like protein
MSQEDMARMRRANRDLQGVDVAEYIRAALAGRTDAIPTEVADGFRALMEMLDPAIEIDTSGVDMPGFGVLRGPDATRELWRRWIEGWEQYSWTQSNWSAVGDNVIADVRVRATGKTSGVHVTWDHCHVWTFRDGKVVRWLLFNDRASALRGLKALSG